MPNTLEIHDQFLEYLLETRNTKKDLGFTLRRSNREGRLKDGYQLPWSWDTQGEGDFDFSVIR